MPLELRENGSIVVTDSEHITYKTIDFGEADAYFGTFDDEDGYVMYWFADGMEHELYINAILPESEVFQYCGQYLLNIESTRQSRAGGNPSRLCFFATRIGSENCGDIGRLQNAAFFSKMLPFLGRSIVLEVEGMVESKTVDPSI